jgi:hypothetical protein
VPDDPPGDPTPGRRRGPGWREVAFIAVVILAAVFAVEILSASVPAVGEAFRDFPVTVAVLVVGTAAILLVIASRRPRR